MEEKQRHPVFFARGRVDLCMRLQVVGLLLAAAAVLAGAVWWLARGPGWMLMLAGVGLALLTFLLSVAWRVRHEKQWWGGKRGWPPYLDEQDGGD